MKIRKFLIHFSIISLIANHTFAAEPACAQKDRKSQIRANLTPRGLEKLVKLGLSKAKKPILKKLRSIKIPDINKHLDSKACAPDKIEKMELKVAWSKCPGVPLALISDKGLTLSELGRPLPSNFSFTNTKLDELELGEIETECKELECDITIPVSKLTVSTDMKVDRSHDKRQVLGVNNATLSIGSNNKDEVPKIRFKARLNLNGEMEELIQIPDDFLKSKIPMDTVKVGIAGKGIEERLQDNFKEVMDRNLYADILLISTEARKKFGENASQSKGYKEWREKEIRKLQDKYFDIAKFDLDNSMKQFFYNKKSYELFSVTGIIANERGGLAQELISNLGPVISNAVSDKVEEIIKPFTKKIPMIHKDLQVKNTTLKVQDFINHNKYKNAHKEMLDQFNKCNKSLKRLDCDFSEYENLMRTLQRSSNERDTELLFKMRKVANVGYAALSKRRVSGFFKKKNRKNALEELDNIRGKLFHQTVNAISENLHIRNLEQQVSLIVKHVEKTDDLINMYLTTCIGCGRLTLPEIEEKPMESDINSSRYDLSVGVSLDAINATMEKLQKDGKLNFCITDNKYSACEDSGFFDDQQRIEFKKAPKVVWDEKKKAYILKVSDLLREQDILGLPTSLIGNRDYSNLDIPMKPEVTPDGKSVRLVPLDGVNLDYAPVRDVQSLLVPGLLTIVAPYAGIAFEVARAGAHELVTDYATSSIRDKMMDGIGITDRTPVDKIIKIHSGEKEIRVYTVLDDPE